MQRYHAGSCTSAVNNGAISGLQSRDASRADPSTLPTNFSLNARRTAQPNQYKLRCDKEPLNSRVGPPDFHPQTPICPEETLTREYVQSGYRETVEGLEESREILLSQVQYFNTPTIAKSKEAIRKCHRAINESRAQKRKAGQVYGVPLSGTLLTKSGIFPEQRPCGEDFKRKWIEGLSQPHKRLRSLADLVPHGNRRKSPFEVLIANNVPLLRATWFVKVTYLNQVRTTSSNSSSGYHDKAQVSRSEQWTKDIIEYLQCLLDEFLTRNNTHSALYARGRSSQMIFTGTVQQKSDSYSSLIDGEEPSLYNKWWYVVRIVHWHHAEGLVIPSLIIDWVLNQLQEKELLNVLQLLLPIIYGVIETVVSSQTYVRTLVRIAVRFIQEPSPGGSDLVDNSRRAYTTAAVVEMLRYLVLAVPDTFVALDCFPLPACVISNAVNDGSFLSKMAEDAKKVKGGQIDVSSVLRDKNHDVQADSFSFQSVVSSIQKRSETLARAAKPNHPGYNVAKFLKVLDQTLMHGDVGVSCKLLLENTWDEIYTEHWSAEVCPCLLTSLKHISKATPSLLYSIFLICEWATCEFRDVRAAPPLGLKFTGRRDFSHIFIAIRLLKLKMAALHSSNPRNKDLVDIFESPSLLHDVIVCWIDQHEVHNREGFTRVQLLVRELMRSGIFNPLAYGRQLIVSGIMDGIGPMVTLEKRKRHYKLLKQLPSPYILDALEEAKFAEPPILLEAMNVYSNERRLLLDGLLGVSKFTSVARNVAKKKKYLHMSENGGGSPSSVDQWYFQAASKLSTDIDMDVKLGELKASISALLQFPNPSSSADTAVDESQVSSKRPAGVYNRTDGIEETSGCEECRRAKRQKLSEEMSSILQSNPAEDEAVWWIKKGLQYMESYKAEPPPKLAKQTSRSRQKSVRKTQSLAQLDAARIEGSQGASTSHVCENRIGCPHHRSVSDDITKPVDVVRKPPLGDIVSVGKLLKQMRFVEKRKLSVWLISAVKNLIEEAERTVPKVGQYGRTFPANDGRSSIYWRLGEDELSKILYLMDVCHEYTSAMRFLLWLLPKIPNNPSSAIPSRSIMMLPRNADNDVYNIGEAFLLSSIRSYENIIVAADLIPETLSATMNRAATFLASKGRVVSASPALSYTRQILKKFSNLTSVVEWEKTFKSTCDKRQISEIDSAKSSEGDFGFTLGVPNGVEDLDDYFRQKITGAARVSRVGLSMKEIVNKHVDEAFQYFYSKDRKPYGAGTNKIPSLEKWEDGYPLAQKIVQGLIDCMRQTGGAAQEGDPSLVSSAIAAIVNNVGQVIGRIPDLSSSNNQSERTNVTSSSGSLNFARRILRVHITCLCILKEALGERQSRVFEVALATESSSALMQTFAPGKAPRSQFQMSPESIDFNANLPNENHSNKAALGRAARITAVSSLVVGAILQGVSSLDRMVTLFRIKEGLDLMQFARSLKTNMNGNSRSMGVSKIDNLIEVSVIWFRVLVGNCRTVCDGLIVELLGEASVVALSRMQRMLSLNLVFPPAYSMFAFVIWKPMLDASVGVREESHQLSQSLGAAIGDAIKHLPFRDICFRNAHGLYDLIAADTLDSEFVSMLQSSATDSNLKAAALAPLRSRLFLDALIDCKMPEPVLKLDGGNWISGQGELKKQCAENVKKLMGRLVHVLDTLQPAKFHWQWVELRFLLNEQAVNEKIMENEISLTDAIRSLSPHPDKNTASENESNFVQIILTRLLVRPDAAPLFSEAVHLLGKSLEDSMLSQAKWLLRGAEVLYGKKTIWQKVMNIAADIKELSVKPQFWKPWGWFHADTNSVSNKGERLKSEAGALEEGEVVDEGSVANHSGKEHGLSSTEGSVVSQQHLTERALIELILPCVDQGSDDLRYSFASEMIKQMSNIEQQINTVTRGGGKSMSTPSPAIGSPANKSGSRKSAKSSSPGLPRQANVSADTVPPSPAALRASMTLRLQFLLRLLPVICGDREPSSRNMRYVLASVILRLLGSRVVHEDSSHYVNTALTSSNRDAGSLMESYTSTTFLCGESLFDCLLLVLHVLLSSYQPSWLKLKSDSKSTESGKDYAAFDREVAESLQNDLDRMELPETIRWRIQSALPILTPPARPSLSCQPPSVPSTALACLQPSNPVTVLNPCNSNPPQRNPGRTNMKTKSQMSHPDLDMEIDQWTILEDGAGAGQPSPSSTGIGSSDHANFKASFLLKGAVRVRRTDLTYIGAVDEDS
ncbi:mediator of RNA polymerase II transcription subunit 12-like [Salvia hispanica]|uniref:mediator of RNA polymerase II transcription subunit 12-like n=1 Tax=Salvia hispanica TaxID=49212 RepID=UPI002009C594|nr:mediator of RNA polymerase II transcription subunit 12-like [Salvia hispanica]XP_047979943.1 mediator of RNA polymerase II transcription subunit 12-like [Salvia hispanica]XP_047979944.1 mediator of RNA polymerase II transcription subunit 12-like [Salvia hispanica]